MSEATEPPRWVCSSARPSIRRAYSAGRAGDEVLQIRQEAGVDRVRQRVLAVEQRGAGGLDAVAGGPAEADRDDLVVGAVADRDREAVEAGEVELEAVHLRHEPRQ